MRLRLFSCLVPALFVACGSLPNDPSETEGLATLQGELTNQSAVALDGDVRIAVIWRRPDAQGGPIAYSVAEDVPVEPVFPSKFRVVLHNPPPDEVMMGAGDIFGDDDEDVDAPPAPAPAPNPAPRLAAPGARALGLRAQAGGWPADLRTAVGSIVAYVDDNHNGRLDLVEAGAPGFLDRVVATNHDLILTYFEGTIPDPFGGFVAPPAAGYNVLYLNCEEPPPSGDDDPFDEDGNIKPLQPSDCTRRAFPPSDPFTLPIDSDPSLNDLMCVNGGDDGGEGDSIGGEGGIPDVSVQPPSYPSPDDPDLACSLDGGSVYTLSRCTTASEGLCKGVSFSCVTESYRRPDPAPADWPCQASVPL